MKASTRWEGSQRQGNTFCGKQYMLLLYGFLKVYKLYANIAQVLFKTFSSLGTDPRT